MTRTTPALHRDLPMDAISANSLPKQAAQVKCEPPARLPEFAVEHNGIVYKPGGKLFLTIRKLQVSLEGVRAACLREVIRRLFTQTILATRATMSCRVGHVPSVACCCAKVHFPVSVFLRFSLLFFVVRKGSLALLFSGPLPISAVWAMSRKKHARVCHSSPSTG